MKNRKAILPLFIFMLAFNAAVGTGLFYISSKSKSAYSVLNSEEIVKWINKTNDIEELRDFAYRTHVDRNRKETWTVEQNNNLTMLFIFNAFIFGFFTWHHLKINSNKVNSHGKI